MSGKCGLFWSRLDEVQRGITNFLKYLGQEFMVKFTEGLEYTI